MQSTLAFLLLQATSDAADVTPEITEVDVNVLQLLMEGGWYIMLPLALMSLIGMYVFFERFLAIQKADKVSPDFMNRLKDYISQGNLSSARNLCTDSNTPLGRMLDKGISRIGKPLKDISVAIETWASWRSTASRRTSAPWPPWRVRRRRLGSWERSSGW